MVVSRYWRRLPQYYNLIGKQCTKCSHLMFPPRDVCTSCGSQELKDYSFNGEGTIETFTIIRTPFSDPESEVVDIPAYEPPYVLAIIKLKEGPRLTAQVCDVRPDDVKIGSKVKVAFRKIQEHGKQGVIQYGYKFKLI